MTMKLYWAPQSRAIRAVWMLEEIGQPYERVRVTLRGDHVDAGLARANPMKKVPTLTDGNVNVAETGAICAYLADKFPEAKLAPPIGDPLRGPYLHWLFFNAANMEPAFLQKMMNIEIDPVAAGWGSFDRVMGVVEAAVSDSEWMLGSQFSAADVLMATSLYYGMHIMKVVPTHPAFTDYIARAAARPAFLRANAIDSGNG
jgi:glutathione S-transferase